MFGSEVVILSDPASRVGINSYFEAADHYNERETDLIWHTEHWEVSPMSSSILRPQTGAEAPPPTFQLTHAETGSLSHVDILRLVQAGFALSDVQAMVRSSSLFKAHKLLERIMGKSARTIQRLSNLQNEVRLNPQQSAIALQYAQGLELAVMVFGSQTLAENWLGRSCKHLSGIVPFEMLNTSVGFKVVVEYLERVRLGVYQ